MKIQRVQIEVFKVLKHLDEEINGQNIILLGENGVGKSSFIQFIEIALGKEVKIPVGAAEGIVIANKDGQNWTFKVTTKKGKPVVEITSPDGFTDTRKSALATVAGAMEFDIDEFVKMSESKAGRKEQVEKYKSFLPKEIQNAIQEQAFRVEKSFNERAELNKEIKLLEGYLSEHPIHKVAFDKSVDILSTKVNPEELNQQIEEALKKNKKIGEVKARQEERTRLIDNKRNEIDQILLSIKELDKTSKECESWLKDNHEQDISALIAEREHITKSNAAWETKADYEKQKARVTMLKEESGELSALIDSSRQALQDAVRDFESPVEGLGFDAEQLLYNGIPVARGSMSDSEIGQLGLQMKMAENPDLGIIFIQRGESYGASRLREIQEWASAMGAQIIMEQVQRGTEKLTIELMGN